MSVWHWSPTNRTGVFSPQPSNTITLNGKAILTKGFSITVPRNLILDTAALPLNTQNEALRCWGKGWREQLDEYLETNKSILGAIKGLPGRPDAETAEPADLIAAAKNDKSPKVQDGRSLAGK